MDEWVKMTITGFLLKKGAKIVVKETKGLTLFICKVDNQECKFSSQNRMRKVKN
jgi:hypothetical protein